MYSLVTLQNCSVQLMSHYPHFKIGSVVFQWLYVATHLMNNSILKLCTFLYIQVNSTLSQTSNFQPNVPFCYEDITFRAVCTVHLLRTGVEHLTGLLLDSLPHCSYCTSLEEDVQRELNQLRLFFSGNYLDQILPSQCVSFFLLGIVESVSPKTL